MANVLAELLDDLAAERAVTAAALDDLPDETWDNPSPAEGWTLRDCVVHLAETDEHAAAIAEGHPPDTSGRPPREPGDVLTAGMRAARTATPAALLAPWQHAGDRMIAALRTYAGDERLTWAGRTMSVVSFTTARLMEHWSHGLDILETAGVAAIDSDRLRHIAYLGYITRDFAFRTNGLTPPATALRVDLTAPSGAHWIWGPEDAADRIIGPAGDFCRVVTQRIHYSDTALQTTGPHAQEFLAVAQAFAGPPGKGRPPKHPAR